MPHSYLRILLLGLLLSLVFGCSHFQPTKNVWKTTKSLWNTYLSPPATLDYESKGNMSPYARALSVNMLGIDQQLSRFERVMQNADKPPTQEWLDNLFATFPWIDGFAGVKYEGTILGQQPETSLKELDFNPLLYEDKKQNSRALRADVQPSPMGPEIMLATPLYDGVDFLGVVVAYFEMRSLMRYSENPEDIVVLCPTGLLWPGKYDFAATPLSGVDWQMAVTNSSAGTCSNANGSFYYIVRYLGNLPLVFATPVKGNFPAGSGQLEQGAAFFPQEREKMAPPPATERKRKERSMETFGRSEEMGGDGGQPMPEGQPQDAAEMPQAPEPVSDDRHRQSNEIQPGSRESMLLKSGRGRGGRAVEERQLEGENVEVERVQRPRTRVQPVQPEPEINLIPDTEAPSLPGGRPSPFGPREEEPPAYQRPSPFGPRDTGGAESGEHGGASQSSPGVEEPANSGKNQRPDVDTGEKAPTGPALLPGGRPSPFGPAPAAKPEAPAKPEAANQDSQDSEPLADGETPE